MSDERLHMEMFDMETTPRRFSRPELTRVGVDLVGTSPIRLRCTRCHAEWVPVVGGDGRIGPGYWLCRGGCNAPTHAGRADRILQSGGDIEVITQ